MWRCGSSRADASVERAEQVVRRQVLERLEPMSCGALVGIAVEVRDGLAQADVADRPRARTREMTREEPLRRPLADAAQLDEARLHLFVGKRGEPVEIDGGAREADDVLRLAAREAEGHAPRLFGSRDALARRERPDAAGGNAEGADEPAADRERRVQRDLLRRDRRHERL